MSFLNIFKSKTIWGQIGAAALLGAQFLPVAAQYVAPTTPLGAALAIGAIGFTAYGRIKAKQPIGPVVDDTITKTMLVVHDLNGQPPPTSTQILQVKDAVKTN